MKKSKLLLGDEALALGAMDSGVKAFFGYPGTPSTEIIESAEALIKKENKGRVAEWAANEKVAYEFSLGASYTGHRTVVTMKHVGLNVAFDAFVNSAITGVNGGLVVAVADDPSMHSSQNEQDTRPLADFAGLPLLEPATPQEVYEFTLKAFDISEKLKLPVVIKLVTRLAHSRGEVFRIDKISRKEPTNLGIPSEKDKNDWVLVPSIARGRYRSLRAKQPRLVEMASEFNSIKISEKVNKGVILAGMGQAYFDQFVRDNNVNPDEFNQLRVSSYPLNKDLLVQFTNGNKDIYVFEENYPYIEDMITPFTEFSETKVHGRRDGTLTIDGELSVGLVRKSLSDEKVVSKVTAEIQKDIAEVLETRPPKLCDGCGHTDAFKAIKLALNNIGVSDPRIFGDIGCYTLGVLPPHNGINTCVEMGASLSMAYGAAKTGMSPTVGIIGDSTFLHSGLPTLISIAKADVNVNAIVMDNAIVAMTGQQVPVAAGVAEDLAAASGLSKDQIHVLTPLPKQHESNIKKLEEIFKDPRPSLIVFRRECIMAMRRKLY